jgi:hypothetical protein
VTQQTMVEAKGRREDETYAAGVQQAWHSGGGEGLPANLAASTSWRVQADEEP